MSDDRGYFAMGMGLPTRSGLALLGLSLPLTAAGVALSAPAPSPSPAPAERDVTYFEAKVRPLLAKRCFACHSQKIAQGGLRLDDGAAMRRGGDSGPAIAAGKPEESRLLEAVRYANPHLQMPPSGKLPDAEIEILTTWVTQGAVWPSPSAAVPGAAAKPKGPHWAFQPLKRTVPPVVKDARWASRRIDQYLLARVEKAGLRPSPRADRRTLIRRISFDLTGLPPTPAEIDAFVNDPAPDAYSRLVDRLLASPSYGERWGRHWLDLVRYCDVPESWAQTDAQPWLYRDWVVKALNEDLPYDKFVRRQLAADQVDDLPPSELAALGFLGLSPSYWKELKLSPDVIKTVVAEEWEERITAVSGTFLGLTVACARCHDHKFDPVSQKDYYALAGVFASTRLVSRPLLPDAESARVLKARGDVTALEAEVKRLTELAAKDAAKAPELREQANTAQQRAAELKRTPGYDAPTAYAVQDAYLDVLPDGPAHTQLTYQDGVGRDVPMQLRGNPAKPGPMVPRGFVAVLSEGKPVRFTHGSGRRELADAMTREGAPLAARVIVNRVWKHHFGKGIVETPSNFGIQGDHPTHPELLDDLAARFIENGWSLKWLHREIVLSSTYQQASAIPPGAKAVALDPDNRLLWRMNRRRLEVEPWRDAILSASGVLDAHVGGAAQELSDPKNVRRTLYGVVKRRELDDLLRLYDFPDPTAHSPARFDTTTPLQQLYVLNSDFIRRQAEALAVRVRKEAPEGVEGQIQLAHRLLYGRAPSEKELAAGRTFLGASNDVAWKQYCEVLLARNELMFVE